ncbi:MAG TPA: hypothetical protein VEK35_00410 [Roseiarcus sp.]|nr:hypothetical protein [Roseiarcus sp.]
MSGRIAPRRFGLSCAAALAVALVLAPGLAYAKSPLAGCDAFLANLRKYASDLQIDYSHSVVVSRVKTNLDVFEVTTNSDVDGTLTCRGDELQRFEARVGQPATAHALSAFERLQNETLRAALGWDAGKATAKLGEMGQDAREYFAASKERGDAYIAGKTEEHLPGGVGLGLIYTETDRALIIVGPNG